MTICFKFGTDGWYCVTKSKISFSCFFVGGLTFFDQSSLLKRYCIIFERPDPLFKGRL